MIITYPSNNDKCTGYLTLTVSCHINRNGTVNVSVTVVREGHGDNCLGTRYSNGHGPRVCLRHVTHS
jgi:hypothetical protein